MKKIFLIGIVLMTLVSCTGVSVVYANTHQAQDGGGNTGGNDGGGNTQGVNTSIPNPFNFGDSLPEFIAAVVERVLLPLAGVIAVIAFIWSGFLFVTAQGDPTKLETAKRALLYTAIGTAILLGAIVLTDVITGTIDSLKSTP